MTDEMKLFWSIFGLIMFCIAMFSMASVLAKQKKNAKEPRIEPYVPDFRKMTREERDEMWRQQFEGMKPRAQVQDGKILVSGLKE